MQGKPKGKASNGQGIREGREDILCKPTRNHLGRKLVAKIFAELHVMEHGICVVLCCVVLGIFS